MGSPESEEGEETEERHGNGKYIFYSCVGVLVPLNRFFHQPLFQKRNLMFANS